MKCERCKIEAVGYALHDYCATCSKNLCDVCMVNGCCKTKPARSGQSLDAAAEEKAGTP
jgi:hypothetical protein